MMMSVKSSSTRFGDFDFLAELDKLCECPTYKHIFDGLGRPSLAIYRSTQPGLRFRGHAQPGRHHIHLTIGAFARVGEAKALLAHELAHLVSHHMGYDGKYPSGRGSYHHERFDEVLRILIYETYGLNLEVGERRGGHDYPRRYDYSRRVEKLMASDLFPENLPLLFSLEPPPERKNQPHQLGKKQDLVVLDMLGFEGGQPAGQPRIRIEQSVLYIPLNEESVHWFLRQLGSYWVSPGGKVETALIQRIGRMWAYMTRDALTIA
jgi:hypothetical protein